MDIFSPVSLEEALQLYSSGKGQVLAGGTDLLLHINHLKSKKDGKAALPEFLLSIRNIVDLKKIQMDEDASVLRIGSSVTFSELIESDLLRNLFPSLWKAVLSVGSVQIRNIGTMGGNICNSSPAADSVPVLYSLNAKCVLSSRKGSRTLSIDEVILNKGKNCLASDELLTEILIPISDKAYITAFSKLGKRNALAISRASVAVYIELKSVDDPIIEKISLCTGSLGVKSNHELEAEKYLLGKSLFEIDFEKAAETVSDEVESRLRGRSTVVYKKEAIKGLVMECLHDIAESFSKRGIK